uniref:Uncharacterized protein n=1 Tax=Salix viminalis TaxID=40686 RepID=A0A6N2LXK4_SALVM
MFLAFPSSSAFSSPGKMYRRSLWISSFHLALQEKTSAIGQKFHNTRDSGGRGASSTAEGSNRDLGSATELIVIQKLGNFNGSQQSLSSSFSQSG